MIDFFYAAYIIKGNIDVPFFVMEKSFIKR